MKLDLQRGEIISRQTDINELEKYLEQVKKEAQSDEKNKIIAQLTTENHTLKEQNERLHDQVNSLQHEASNRKDNDFLQIQQLSLQVKHLTDQTEKQAEKIHKFEDEKVTMFSTNQSLRKDLKIAEQNIQQLKQSMSELE